MTLVATHDSDPLASMRADAVHLLVLNVQKFIDPITRDYRTSPRERRGSPADSFCSADYVSGRDVEQWAGKLARFKAKWESRPPAVRTAIIDLAFPSDSSDQEGSS